MPAAGPADPVSIVYARHGGRAPASFERLELAPDGSGTYVAGNAWPNLRPYSEVGVCAGSLAPAQAAALREALARAASAPDTSGYRGHLDSGIEAVLVEGPDAALRHHRWSPRAPPPGLAPAAEALHGAAAALRSSRRSTLAGRLEREGTALWLVLSATGTEPFRLIPLPGDEEGGLMEVRAGAVSADEAAHWGWPARLASGEPVPLALPGAGPDGLVVAPGREVRIPVAGAPARGLVACLVRLAFPVPSLDGGPAEPEAAWLMPDPVAAG